MRLIKRKPKVNYDDFVKLQNELREVRHELYPKEAYGWITINMGANPNPTKFVEIEEKLNLLAKELNLEFSKIKGNYKLDKPETEKKSKDTYGLKTLKVK